MIRQIPLVSEWLVFLLGDVSFAIPSNNNQSIGKIDKLLVELIKEPIPHFKNKQGLVLYSLDQQFKLLSTYHQQSVYIAFYNTDESFGLLCDEVNIITLPRKLFSIDSCMIVDQSPLLGVTIIDGKPIFLSCMENIIDYIQLLKS
jgi:hypothetical protein